MTTPTYVIFINGTYGSGKSSTLDHVGDLLAEHGQPFSLLDVDWFHRSWPPAPDDPDNVLAEAANLAAVWSNYRRTGPHQPVVAGVLASGQDRHRYEAAFGLPVRSVRLTATASVIDARLRGRCKELRQSALDWHRQRHADLAERLARADLDELAVDTDVRRPGSVAEVVIDHFGLLATPPTPTPTPSSGTS